MLSITQQGKQEGKRMWRKRGEEEKKRRNPLWKVRDKVLKQQLEDRHYTRINDNE